MITLEGTISYEDDYGNGRLSMEEGSVRYSKGKSLGNGSKVKIIGKLKFKEEKCVCGAIRDEAYIDIVSMELISKGESVW
jgi:hypothetical protein